MPKVCCVAARNVVRECELMSRSVQVKACLERAVSSWGNLGPYQVLVVEKD
jgi:hypothetical protein